MYCNQCGTKVPDGSNFCNMCGVKLPQDNQNKELSEKELTIEACKDCIKKHLKSPATVQFISVEQKGRDKYGRIYLEAEVDAQNTYGAIIRQNLRIVLQKVNKNGTYEAFEGDAVRPMSFINTEDVVKRINRWNKDIW